MSQIFVGLDSSPFVMGLCKPNHLQGEGVPRLEDMKAFRIPAGHGVMIHVGTWHDFSMAFDGQPTTVFTMNSDEVVTALASAKAADEMDTGDVYKIDILRRTSKVQVSF